ncbi:MAG: hypothetical protein HWD59_03270 [Coxiellaceae bacterium]|nr:MAG: hypothetical protein HWD59_03270 [Coxiellaceae bacterium]
MANNLDVDAIDSMGQTAFHYAVMKDNLDLLGIILQSRPAIVQDSKQQTPLDLICQIIVSMGINKVRVAIMQSVLLYFYQNIIDINFNSVDLINLHHAAAIGNLMAAKLLQEMGHGTEAIDAKPNSFTSGYDQSLD